jgi:uncharacterized protein (DUF2336 family)
MVTSVNGGAGSAPILSTVDIARLSAGASGETKADLASRVAKVFVDMSEGEERTIALDILRIFARDIEVKVREALAAEVRHSTDLPRDLAVTIARDIDSVATPFLAMSPVLSDADLIDVLREGSSDKQVAIARRPRISAALGHEIIATDNIHAVATLSGNDGADLTEGQLDLILDRFGFDERIRAPLVERKVLPRVIVERLVSIVSDRLREQLLEKHPIAPELAGDLALTARNRVLQSEPQPDTAEIVATLHRQGRLTPREMLRAACKGDIMFVEEAMACLADLQIANAHQLIHDAGPLGLKAIYSRAGLPETLFAIFRTAIDVIRETAHDGGPQDQENRERRVIERVLTRHPEMDEEDSTFLLEELTKLSADTAGARLREVARQLSASAPSAVRQKAS